ncbi:hypothetical protein [Planctomicrobium sp. SH664]|uniref:hypothetical protein n=1 Tax=Planctomicrobium sp. SH664 TaxID=3448125 RepID=UPI003F5C8FB0
MKKQSWAVLCLVLAGRVAAAQDPLSAQNVGYGDAYLGASSVGSNEPLFRYDDQERWKHGYLHDMPYYGGYHSFLPYNYHNVFAQSQTAAGWGMSPVLPYSQQFWHRYENMTDLSRGHHTPLQPYLPPVREWDHYPKPYNPTTTSVPTPQQGMPVQNFGAQQSGSGYAVQPVAGSYPQYLPSQPALPAPQMPIQNQPPQQNGPYLPRR